MSFLNVLGQIGGAILGIGAGAAGGAISNAQQLKQQEKLMGMQIKGTKEMRDYEQQKQLEMWEKTNYDAQKAQLKKAGLNPALMYGMSGGGGATVGGGPGLGVTGGTAQPTNLGMGIEAMMMQKQMELIEAQTKKTEAEAAKTAGVDTKVGEATAASLLQGVENLKAQKVLTDAQTKAQGLENDYLGRTLEDRIDKIAWEAAKAANEVNLLSNDLFISDSTKAEKIQIIQAEAIAAGLRNQQMELGLDLTAAQIYKIMNDVKNDNTRITYEQKLVAVQEKLAEFNTSLSREALGAIGGLITTAIGKGLSKAPIINKGGTTINNK